MEYQDLPDAIKKLREEQQRRLAMLDELKCKDSPKVTIDTYSNRALISREAVIAALETTIKQADAQLVPMVEAHETMLRVSKGLLEFK